MSKHRQGGFLLSKIHQTASRVFARMLRERNLDINPAQGRVLFVLWEQGPMTINNLAKQVSLGKSTLTNAIDRLEESGQVVRVRTSRDRRSIRIELTPKNKKLHGLYEDVSRDMADIFYTGFTRQEAERFEGFLSRILANLNTIESDLKE
jgi:MarR family transcriptional regulator, organic hydroperoxide resistance regulator